MDSKIKRIFDTKIFNNKKISLEAKGLYMIILNNLHKSLDYDELFKLSSTSRVNTKKTLNELVKHELLFRKKIINDNGVLTNYKYRVYINETNIL